MPARVRVRGAACKLVGSKNFAWRTSRKSATQSSFFVYLYTIYPTRLTCRAFVTEFPSCWFSMGPKRVFMLVVGSFPRDFLRPKPMVVCYWIPSSLMKPKDFMPRSFQSAGSRHAHLSVSRG